MNSQQIADKLKRAQTSIELTSLAQACALRRDELRARIAAITPSWPTTPPERESAILVGPEALHTLDREIDEINIEIDHIAAIEPAIAGAHETALDAEARREVPIAHKQIPKAMTAVRTAFAQLSTAVASLNALIEKLGDYERLENRTIPLDDDELAEILALRDQLWKTPAVRPLLPPATHPKSLALFYETRTNGIVITRSNGVYLPDVGKADY